MFQSLSFEPFPLLTSSLGQTLLGGIPSLIPPPPSRTFLVPLDDGDTLAAEVSTPWSWRPEDPTVILVHGLCGSDRSPYLLRLARKLFRRDMRVVRANLRGCGSGRLLAKRPYHGGCSDDIIALLTAIREGHPDSSTSLVGFSLGGNIVLKAAGELKEAASDLLDLVVAIAPPVELESSTRLIDAPGNRFYQSVFMKALALEVEERHRVFPELGPFSVSKGLTLFGFDQLYTAPMCGFEDALSYYKESSAKPLVPEIQTRCHILFAEDDPLVEATALDKLALPDAVKVWKTRFGGHMGFLGRPWQGHGVRWMDNLVLQWIASN